MSFKTFLFAERKLEKLNQKAPLIPNERDMQEDPEPQPEGDVRESPSNKYRIFEEEEERSSPEVEKDGERSIIKKLIF